MLVLLSPAKSLDLDSPLVTDRHTDPRMLEESEQLIEVMRQKSPEEIARLMKVSDAIAMLNHQRFQDFTTPFTASNARPAVLTFSGDVYQGMRAAERFDTRDFTEAQKTVRILSGLYGLLRPLDLIQPYRLEMGTRLATERGKDLYEWWGDRITEQVRADLAESPGAGFVVNLASHEYSSAVDLGALGVPVVSPRFEDRAPSGGYKVISFHAKKARGEMAAWMVQQRMRKLSDLAAFDGAGYRLVTEESTDTVPVFRR